MSHHCYTVVDELRSWTRFAKEQGTDFAVICHSQGVELLAEVHDESLGGLGVFVEDVEYLCVGQQVEIVYEGEFYRAHVRHVQPQDDRGYVVGFACERLAKCIREEGGLHASPVR